MEDDELKEEIRLLADELAPMSREDTRAMLFSFVQKKLNDRKEPIRLTLYDVDRIRDGAIGQSQQLPIPLYIDNVETDDRQRIAFCYLAALMGFLRKLGVIKFQINTNTKQPFLFSIYDED